VVTTTAVPGGFPAHDRNRGTLHPKKIHMGCLLAIIGFFSPRLVLAGLWLFSAYPSRAFEGFFWPLIGFFFMPFTTLAYAVCMNENNHSVSGWYLLLFLLGLLFDLGGSSAMGRTAKRTLSTRRRV